MQLVMMDSMWVCDIVLFINITIYPGLIVSHIIYDSSFVCIHFVFFSALNIVKPISH